MTVFANRLIGFSFIVKNAAGELVNADSTPTAAVYFQGGPTTIPVTVTPVSTGVYQAEFTSPADWSEGDQLMSTATAVVDGTPYTAVVFQSSVARSATFVLPAEIVTQAQNQTPGSALMIRGTAWVDYIDNITDDDLVGVTAIYYGLKDGDVDDDQAIAQVKLNLPGGLNGGATAPGLQYINKTAAADAAFASIAHSKAGPDQNRFEARLRGEATAQIPPTSLIEQTRPGFTRVVESEGYLREFKLVGPNMTDKVISAVPYRIRVYPDVNKATE